MPPIHGSVPSHPSKVAGRGGSLRLAPTGRDSLALLKSLNVGDRLSGRVVRIIGDSRLLIDVDGNELVATSPLSIRHGDRIQGVVLAKGPPLVLRILGGNLSAKTRMYGRFRSLASQWLSGENEYPLIALLETPGVMEADWAMPLIRWLSAFALTDAIPIDPQNVRKAMTHGGTSYEPKLVPWIVGGMKGDPAEVEQDLKGVALRLLGELGRLAEGRNSFSEKVMGHLQSLLGRIELMQVANWLAKEEGLSYLFQIFLYFGGELRTADLLVSPPRRKRGKGKGLRVLLLLDLGRLGHFQVEAFASEKDIVAAIGVDREETVALVRSMLRELKEGLEDRHFRVTKIVCFLLENPSSQRDLFREPLTMERTEGVDVRV